MRTSSCSNENGFTIIEIMIAGAIAMILSLAIASLMFGMISARKKTEERADMFNEVKNIEQTMRTKPVPP